MLVSTICVCSAPQETQKKKRPNLGGPAFELPEASPLVKRGSPAEFETLASDVVNTCQLGSAVTAQELHALSMRVYQASQGVFDQRPFAKLATIIQNDGVPKVRKEIHGEDYNDLGEGDRRDRHQRFKRYMNSCLVQPTEGTPPKTPKPLSYMDEEGDKMSPFDLASPMSTRGGGRRLTFEGAGKGEEARAGLGTVKRGCPVPLVAADVAPIVASDSEFVARVQTRVDGMRNQQDFKRAAQIVIASFKDGSIDHATYNTAAWTLHRAAKQHKELFATRDLRKKFEERLPNPEEQDPFKVADILQHHWAARAGIEDFYRLEDACAKSRRLKG